METVVEMITGKKMRKHLAILLQVTFSTHKDQEEVVVVVEAVAEEAKIFIKAEIKEAAVADTEVEIIIEVEATEVDTEEATGVVNQTTRMKEEIIIKRMITTSRSLIKEAITIEVEEADITTKEREDIKKISNESDDYSFCTTLVIC
jgi:hypothetical protein